MFTRNWIWILCELSWEEKEIFCYWKYEGRIFFVIFVRYFNGEQNKKENQYFFFFYFSLLLLSLNWQSSQHKIAARHFFNNEYSIFYFSSYFSSYFSFCWKKGWMENEKFSINFILFFIFEYRYLKWCMNKSCLTKNPSWNQCSECVNTFLSLRNLDGKICYVM